MAYTLGWSQLYPWLAGQILPIVAYWTIRWGWKSIEWLIPIWVLTTVITVGTGPVKAMVSYRLATPELRRSPRWFALYMVAEPLLYAPFKNLIVRVAHIQELLGEKQWKVTPRAVAPGAGVRPV